MFRSVSPLGDFVVAANGLSSKLNWAWLGDCCCSVVADAADVVLVFGLLHFKANF